MKNYLNPEKVIQRLYTEYKKHGYLILAVDFDDTVYDYHSEGLNEENHTEVLSLVKECSDLGFMIVIWTASNSSRYDMMLEFYAKREIKVASLNKNPIDLPFGNNGKIYYNLLLDDRAGLYSAYTDLRKLIDIIKDEHASTGI